MSGLSSPVPPRTPLDRRSWPSVLGRMLLVVLPGQLLGAFLAVTGLAVTDALRDRPGLSVLIVVAAGVLAGVGLGLVLRPDRDQLVGHLLAATGAGVVVFLLLFGIAQLRLPAASPRASFDVFLLAAVVIAVTQAAVALPLWWARRNRTGDRAVRPA